jgi:hypothetical protein
MTNRTRVSFLDPHGLLPLALALCGLAGLPLQGLASDANVFQAWQPHQEWRIDTGRLAPWAEPGTVNLVNPELAGQFIRFEGNRIVAPHPLGCTDAHVEFVVAPAEGLFQGGLPAPAQAAATALGIAELPLLTWRVNCSTGTFDYHLVSAQQALLGLDQVVWTLQATASDGSPEAVTLDLLRDHMTHDMAFTEATIRHKAGYLSAGLLQAIAGYFALPDSPEEAPAINGDPFTDSQEYPASFVLGEAAVQGSRATVPVLFQDFDRQKRVEMVLQHAGSGWLIDDLRFADGMTLRDLLQSGASDGN